MTDKKTKAEQVAQAFWKDKASEEWKKIYQETVEAYMVMNYIEPPELDPSVATCKDIIPQFGSRFAIASPLAHTNGQHVSTLLHTFASHASP